MFPEFIKQYPEHDRKWIVRKLNEEGLNSFKYKIEDYHRSTGKTKSCGCKDAGTNLQSQQN